MELFMTRVTVTYHYMSPHTNHKAGSEILCWQDKTVGAAKDTLKRRKCEKKKKKVRTTTRKQ